MKKSSQKPDHGKADVDLVLATKAILERDIGLGLVTEDRLRHTFISRDDRKAFAQELKAKGVSNRKIAKLTSVGEATIRRDVGAPNDAKNAPNDAPTKAEVLQAKDDERKAVLHRKVKIDPRLHIGDFRKQAHVIPDESIELVFTDPPYDRDSIPLYGAAALEASRILKPGGSMICYCGHVILPHVIPQMAQHLKYFWIGAHVHDGGPMARMIHYGIIAGFKPLLWFIKHDDQRGDKQNFVCDTVLVKQEKDIHPWQQAIATAEHFISALTSKDGTVVDFFAGGGTTILAAKQLGRQWTAFEINDQTATAIMGRIDGVQG